MSLSWCREDPLTEQAAVLEPRLRKGPTGTDHLELKPYHFTQAPLARTSQGSSKRPPRWPAHCRCWQEAGGGPAGTARKGTSAFPQESVSKGTCVTGLPDGPCEYTTQERDKSRAWLASSQLPSGPAASLHGSHRGETAVPTRPCTSCVVQRHRRGPRSLCPSPPPCLQGRFAKTLGHLRPVALVYLCLKTKPSSAEGVWIVRSPSLGNPHLGLVSTWQGEGKNHDG